MANDTPIGRREFIRTALVASAGTTAWSQVRKSLPSNPNVLFILADDLGYGDLSCYGRPDYKTPVLDKLAAEGVRLTDAYAAAPVCTPTRCAFHTGRYPQRLAVGLEEPLVDANNTLGLPPAHPTIASLIKQRGYETALIGKWHLGVRPEWGPNQHGYDEFFGFLRGYTDYFDHKNTQGLDLYENLEPADRAGYLTDLLTDRAIEYIGRRRTKPFYLSLHYSAPHWPWEGPEDAAISHAHSPYTDGGNPRVFGAMMKSLDTGVGRVLKALRDAKLDRNTLVIFTSDNGGERYSFNWPFSFQKFNLWEGGIRVPAIVRWPGVIPAGRVTPQPAITMDWTATILALANAKADAAFPLDGQNILPVCIGTQQPFERTLFWRIAIHDAARIGRWKYLKEGNNEHLFDLSVDPGEKAEMKSREPAMFDRIRSEYNRWNATMLPKKR